MEVTAAVKATIDSKAKDSLPLNKRRKGRFTELICFCFTIFLLLFSSGLISAQDYFDYYGPAPFGQILGHSFDKSWTPNTISDIENLKYVVLLDQATKSTAVMLDGTDFSTLTINPIDSVSVTYGSVMRSIFQLVDINTHLDNSKIPLAGEYRINPMLASYYGLNSASDGNAICTDGGTRYISDASHTGYVLVEIDGTPASATIKAVSQWEYDATQDSVIEASGWTTKWLKIDGTSLSWTSTESEATNFFLADANDLIDLEVNEGSDFNPFSVPYQPNATAAIPDVETIDENMVFANLPSEVDPKYLKQLGTSAEAAAAASAMLDTIETTLLQDGDSLRYPKSFYLALRENMLSQKIAAIDIYNAKPGYNTVPDVYFTNATDDNGVPHPFMVIASLACSTRPNLLIDVHRPPGATHELGYSEIPVTRHGKLGDFLIKIPLKKYGLIDYLLANDLTPIGGDLAADYDNTHGTTTEKNQYNYAALASIGVAVDGVTIYPAFNNNIRFAVEDGEITDSGIHVGGGLELHYHADGNAYNGNGIDLYNKADYEGHNHPPVIGMSYDGIAVFGQYDDAYPNMAGYNIPLDEYGGHNHGDGFGYHYHAHTENITASDQDGTVYNFNEHFLLEGAWKGNINSIPGFYELKFNQFRDPGIARYAGASYNAPVSVGNESRLPKEFVLDQNYPNPFNPTTTIRYELPKSSRVHLEVFDLLGRKVATLIDGAMEAVGYHSINFNGSTLASGFYIYRLEADGILLNKKMMLVK